MAGSVNIALKANPYSGVPKTGDWLDLNNLGINFGNAPDIPLFFPVYWEAGKLMQANTPNRGTLTDISNNAIAVADSGEVWLPFRDPTQLSSSSKNAVTFGFETTPFNRFYFFHRLKGQTGKYFPFATAIDSAPSWADTNMKPLWFTDVNNANYVDMVSPTYGSSGLHMFSNTNEIYKNPSGGGVFYPRSTDLFVTEPTSLGFFQSGDESVHGARDATVNLQRYDSAGFAESTFTCDPFNERDPIRLTITVQASATYQVTINGTPVPNPYISGASSTSTQIRDGIIAATNANQSVVYAEVFTGDSTKIAIIPVLPSIPTITATANLAVTNGNPILGESKYFRLQWGSYAKTPAGGWVDRQMLINWVYLATGDNCLGTIYIGNAPTLAACRDPLPFAWDHWSTSRVVIDKLGKSGYVHFRRHDGAIYNNIKGGIV